MNRAGVYLHIPFCAKRCGYCDFNVYMHHGAESKRRYVDALCAEIAARSDKSVSVPTVFFGGGTPTQLPAEDLARVLEAVRAAFAVEAEAEVTVEANPDDASCAYFSTLRAAGVNRLSLGVQTFDDGLLRMIDRVHGGADAKRAVETARAAGFENLSLDLMFGLPHQTLRAWDETLRQAFALSVPHLSIYSLIVEERTVFWAKRERGLLPLPSEKAEAAMFGRTIAACQAAGLPQYEVSNFARPGFESRHNQIYWRNEDYFGFGAGAVSYRGGVRFSNERYPNRYAAQIEASGGAVVDEERSDAQTQMGETIMLALRLRRGLDLEAFARRFGVRAEGRYSEVLARFTGNGLLRCEDGFLFLTERGLFLANDVMAAFLP